MLILQCLQFFHLNKLHQYILHIHSLPILCPPLLDIILFSLFSFLSLVSMQFLVISMTFFSSFLRPYMPLCIIIRVFSFLISVSDLHLLSISIHYIRNHIFLITHLSLFKQFLFLNQPQPYPCHIFKSGLQCLPSNS